MLPAERREPGQAAGGGAFIPGGGDREFLIERWIL
jgi:hypothetical protein